MRNWLGRLVGVALVCVLSIGAAQAPPVELASGLKELQGDWVVLGVLPSASVKFVLAEQIGLTGEGAKIVVRGNELLQAGKVLAILTTDFSASGLDLEKQVWQTRRPIMLTLPNGKGILCAFAIHEDAIELVHPHTMGRIGAGNWLSLLRPAKAAKVTKP